MRKLLLLAALCLPLLAGAQEKTLVAAADPYPPYVDPQMPGDGLAMEIARAAFKTQGYRVKLEMMPWARAEKGVMDGRFDILVDVWRTEARVKEMLFSVPYAVSKIKFLKRKDDPFEFNGLDSLSGKRIGVIRGYGYNDAFNAATHFTREEVTGLDLNIKKLLLKRIDLTPEDEIAAKVFMRRLEPNIAEQLDFTSNALATNPLYVSAGLKNPRHKEIIEAFNKGMQTIKADGTLIAIEKRYGLVK
ncbi:substrate-binding periplasmic protein [Rhodoferax aquaticus]|uniref:Transporter substrate-binding domain-containing protein n=1 Tax=Rhodoferax aquaticus TaxID=2527691 RepID=A0A515EMS3_9BURK|nr:transporter substrate-binding domain-containing protein [Rhodoferax aquaticus]QDL53951.1 transporter substrate-binding domain-containing protein [Rhodoferax aquaticus]